MYKIKKYRRLSLILIMSLIINVFQLKAVLAATTVERVYTSKNGDIINIYSQYGSDLNYSYHGNFEVSSNAETMYISTSNDDGTSYSNTTKNYTLTAKPGETITLTVYGGSLGDRKSWTAAFANEGSTFIDATATKGGNYIYKTENADGDGHSVRVSFKMPAVVDNGITMMAYFKGSSSKTNSWNFKLVPKTTPDKEDMSEPQAVLAQQTLSNFDAKNTTSINDIQNTINGVIDTTKFTAFVMQTNKVDATESSSGYIKGKVAITSKSNSSEKTEFSYTLVISRLPQSAATVYTTLSKFVNNYAATNRSTENDFTSAVTLTNNALSITASDWSFTKSTDTTEGKLTCNLYVKESGVTKYTINVNKTISKLATSTTTACQYVEQILRNLTATNEMTDTSLLSAVSVGVDTSALNVSMSNFKKSLASESATGLITGTITINDRSTSKDVPVNLTINLLPQSVNTVKILYTKALENLNPTNETYQANILELAYVTNPYISVEIENYSITPSTEETTGLITGNIKITDGSIDAIVPINKAIELQTQSLETVVKLINQIKDNTTATNDLSFDNLFYKFSSVIRNPKISIRYDLNNPPVKTEATQFSDGSMKANLIATDGVDTKEIPIEFTIPRLSQTATGIKGEIEAILRDMIATNETTEDDVLSKVETTNIDGKYNIAFGTEVSEEFNKILATENKPGKITGVIKVTQSGTDASGEIGKITSLITLNDEDVASVDVNLDIAKLNQYANDSLKNNIEAILGDMTATNSTTAQDVLDYVKVNTIYDEKISIRFGNGEGEPFNKIKATVVENGSITGKIYVSDSSESVIVDVKLLIKKLSEELENAKDTIINVVIPNLKPTNDTTKEDIIKEIQDAIGNDITVDIKDFKKEDATTSNDGKVTGTIVLEDKNGNKLELDLDLIISKLPSSSSSGGGGGGGSSSSERGKKNDIILLKLIQEEQPLDVYSKEVNTDKLDETELTKVLDKDKVLNVISLENTDTNKEETESTEYVEQTNITTNSYSWDAVNLNNGYVTKITNNGEEIGSYISAENLLSDALEVQVKMNKTIKQPEQVNIYSYNDDLGKYVLSKTIEDNEGVIQFAATNKKKYLVLREGTEIKTELTANQGWVDNKGKRGYLQKEDLVKNRWLENQNDWYYFDDKGAIKTGWMQENRNWYYLQNDGKMKTGWFYDSNNNNWYYLNKNGTMASNVWIDGYYVNGSGAWVR